MKGLLGAVVSRTTYRRWAYLILGGALCFPYVLLTFIIVPAVLPGVTEPGQTLLIGIGGSLLITVATTFLPIVRVLEGTAVRELLDDPVPGATFGATTRWSVRLSASAMFLAHVVVGGVLSLVTLLVPVLLIAAFAAPFTGRFGLVGSDLATVPTGWAGAWIPLAALIGLLLLAHVVRGAGAVLRRMASVLIGVPAAERIALLQRRTEQLAERNRLAQELHDSVGHALSVVSMQAGAARFALGTAPEHEQVARALGAIERSSRAALDDLDYVLGVLREEPADEQPHAELTKLPELLESTRLAGVTVNAEVSGEVSELPSTVSRQAYRIVQECLTNALRHAGQVPVELRLSVGADRMRLTATNPVDPTRRGTARSGGGRGLSGIRDRVDILGGRFSAGCRGNQWEVAVELPLEAVA